MANRIKGITIELGGDTTKLTDALKKVNGEIRNTQAQLRDTEKLLKLDPGNIDLLKQKQQYLSDAITETKDKLQQEKDALEQLKNAPNVDETKEQQEALTREIAETQHELNELTDSYRNFGSVSGQALQAAGAKIQETGGKIKDVGEGISKHVTAPIVAVGAASVAAWSEVDNGLDIVTIKTGATGEALADMQERTKNLATSIPTDFETAGSAIGEVNTRFGLTGDALESLSGQFIQFASLNNTDVSSSVDNVQKALSAFGLGSEDAGAMLDTMNRVGQNTGISMDALAATMVQNGAALQQMGMSASDAAMFLGQVEVSGADSSQVMMGLKTAMKNAASDGKSLDDVLSSFQTTMNSNASDSEKLSAAYEVFGSRAGAAIYNACSQGQISFEGLGTSLSDNLGSVSNTFNETLDPLDQMTVSMNALKEVGAGLVDAAAPIITDVLGGLKDGILQLKAGWDSLSPGAQEAIVKAALIAAAVGPVIVVIGQIVTSIGTLVSAGGALIGFIGGIAPVIGGAVTGFASFMAPMAPIVLAIGAVVAAGVLLYQNWDVIKEKAGELGAWLSEKWEGIKAGASAAWSTVTSTVSNAWSGIQNTVSTVGNAVKDTAKQHLDAIKQAYVDNGGGIKGTVAAAWEGVKGYYTAGFDFVNNLTGGKLEGIKSAFLNAGEGVKTHVMNMWTGIQTTFSTAGAALQSANEMTLSAMQTAYQTHGGGIKGIVSATMTGIQTVSQTAFNALNTLTGGKLSEIKTAFSGAWNAIKSATTSAFESIKSGIENKINGAKNAVRSAIDAMKGFFHFSWSLPSLKLPHVSISGHFSLNPPSAPHFSISWYKKAMENGMILNSPTIFGMKGGKLLAGGEAGSETVVGTGSLMSMIQSAVGSAGRRGGNINYGGVTVNVYGAPGQDVSELADIIESRINAGAERKGAVFA